MVAIIIFWGFIHTAGFLVGNTRGVHGVPKEALEFSNSFLPSFFNIGITIGTMVSGVVIKRSDIHHIIWVSIVFLVAAFGLSLVKVKTPKEENADATQTNDCPLLVHG